MKCPAKEGIIKLNEERSLNMKKWILIGGGAFVVIIVVVVVLGVSNLGPMIKNAVNTFGPEITKTEVKLGDVGISIFSAEAKLKDFFLGNPEGFKSPQALSVGSIHVNVDEKSITKDTIIIDRIEVVAPEITYEKVRGTDNFKAIQNNVNKVVNANKTAKTSGAEGKEGEGKKIIIRNFIVKDGKVNLTMSALGGKTIAANLPDIHLKDVGQKQGGASPADAFKEIFDTLYAKITSPAVTNVFGEGLKTLTGGTKALTEGVTKQLGTAGGGAKEGVKSATDKLKGMFGK